MLDKELMISLQNLSFCIKQSYQSLPDISRLRQMLATAGTFKKPRRLPADEIEKNVRQKPLAAVDGSRIEYGAFFPYYIVLMRSLAASTFNDELSSSKILTPLDEELYQYLENAARESHIRIEEVYREYLQEAMARLELQTALEAARQWEPYMLILDGGFLLFDTFPEWQQLTDICRDRGILLTGIIEEVATAEIAKWLDISISGRPRIYDRELLFGLFTPGEYLYLKPDYRVKKDYCTVFTRLGSYPQATACEFIPEQEERVEEAMDFLYTITPLQGQGIPAWLQIVDARVRLRRREVDQVMQQLIDDDVYERIFRANREKRAF